MMNEYELSRIYALVVMLVETIFMFFSIKYYNDEKYGWVYQLLGVLSGILTFGILIFCLRVR